MLAHLQTSSPQEGCGILAGTQGIATHLYAIDNKLHSRVAFEMDPRQQLQTMLDMEEQHLDWLAIYHSHPQGPETPSVTDIERAFYPDPVSVIVSLQKRDFPVARGFFIRQGTVQEVQIRIVSDAQLCND